MKSISAGMFWGLASVMFTLCVHIIAQAVKKTDGAQAEPPSCGVGHKGHPR